MIGTALFLLCATAIAHADLDDTDGFYDNGCPKDNTIEKLLPHENCEQYHQCFRGAMISRFCPNGLHFNPDLEKCDWLGSSDCHSNKKEDNETAAMQLDKNNPNHVTLICSSTESNGVLVAHKNCNQFYKCSFGRQLVLNCAYDLLYNTVIEKCDQPQNVDCRERYKPVNESQTTVATTNMNMGYWYSIEEVDQSISDPSQAIAQCSAKRTDGELVPHEYCNKFYKCSGGVPVTVKCPNSFLYNPVKKLCDWSTNVDCDGRTMPETKNIYGYVADMEKTNDYEDNEISGDDDNNSAIATCAADDSDGVLAIHEMCNYFYKCLNRNPVAYSCPGDLLFNSKKYYCDWPSNVDCSNRIKSDGTDNKKLREDPKKAHTVCSAEGADGLLVAHDSCNKFYKCYDAHPVEVKCPGILLYNLKTESCDWPTDVQCKDRTVPDNGWFLKEEEENYEDGTSKNGDDNNLDSGNKKSRKNKENSKNGRRNKSQKSGSRHANHNADLSNAVTTCADVKFDGRLLAHENCNQFYRCLERKSVAFFCPLNLFYNIQKEYCDWSFKVNCGNRVVPKNDSYGEQRNNTNIKHAKARSTVL